MSFICGLILCLLLGAAQSQLGEVETVTSSPPNSAGDNSLQLKHSVNETTYLLCPFNSIEVPEVVWTKDGAALPPDPKFAISEKVTDLDSSLIRNPILRFFAIKRIISSLKIVRLEIEDSGIYTCALLNSTQKNSFNLTITANDPTKLSTNTKNIPRFLCHFQTELQPVSIHWLKDGRPLPEDPKYDIKELRDEVPSILNQIGINLFVSASLLSINGVELGDTGNYSCVDRARKLYIKTEFILELEEGEKGSLELALGGSASFFCQFRMRFPPIAEWTKDGAPLAEDSRIKVINQQREIKHEDFASKDPIVRLLPNKELNSLLTIYNLQPEDAGTYKCRLANTPSLNLHQSWILIVNGTRTEPISQHPKLV